MYLSYLSILSILSIYPTYLSYLSILSICLSYLSIYLCMLRIYRSILCIYIQHPAPQPAEYSTTLVPSFPWCSVMSPSATSGRVKHRWCSFFMRARMVVVTRYVVSTKQVVLMLKLYFNLSKMLKVLKMFRVTPVMLASYLHWNWIRYSKDLYRN
jgi:hypothetical protein